MSFMNERGSVTIYSLIVLVPIMLFLGLIFELTRIHSAEVQAEQKTKAAVRSVLSAYDRELRTHYGLFGLAGNDEQLTVIAENTASSWNEDQGWNMSSPILAHMQISSVYTLADHRFFRQQIMEEMKLKAPIEFTRHLFDKWKDHDDQIQNAAEEFTLSEEMERKLQKREKQLRDAFASLQRMKSDMERGEAILRRPAPEKPAPSEDGEDAATDTEGQEIPVPINPYTDAAAVFSSINQELRTLRDQLREAEATEIGIRNQIAEETSSSDLLASIELYGQAFYTRYNLDAENSAALFGAAQSAAIADPYAEKDFTFAHMFAAFYNRIDLEEQNRRVKHDALEERKKETEEETGRKLGEAKAWIAEQTCKPEDDAHYEKLQHSYEYYLAYNSTEPAEDFSFDSAVGLEQSPKDMQRGSLLQLTSMSNIMRTIRDEAYINEYVMLYFNHRLSGSGSDSIISHVKEHILKNQEAEYILYGFSSCNANRAAAYAELYAARFAVRTIEALVDARKAMLGSPMLVLLTAAAEGAAKAYTDMQKLLNGEEIPVFQKLPNVRMGYADYLRLFMAVHSNETKKMARIQALIEFNSGVNLRQRPVYVQAETRYQLPLWLFPSISKLAMHTEAQEGGGSVHWINKKAEMAY